MKIAKILLILGAMLLTVALCVLPVMAATGSGMPGGNGTHAEDGSSDGTDSVTDKASAEENGGSDASADGQRENGENAAGDSENMMPEENISENDDGSIESGDTVGTEPSPEETDVAEDTESGAEKTSAWLGVLITMIIIVAAVCLVVAFIPKKKG